MEKGRPYNEMVLKLILRNALNWYEVPVKKDDLLANGFYEHNNQERERCFQLGFLAEGTMNLNGYNEQFVTLTDLGLSALKYLYPQDINEFNKLHRQANLRLVANHYYVLIKETTYDIVTKQVKMVFVKSIDSSTGQQTFTLDPKSAMHFRRSGDCKEYVDEYGFDVQKLSSIESEV